MALPMYLAAPDAVQAFATTVMDLLAARLREEAPSGGNDAEALAHALPVALQWPQDLYAHWQDPALLLSQTCGYPLSTTLRDRVQVVGTFAYDAPGAEGVMCSSQLICRSSDTRRTLAALAGGTLAYNGTDSQSGFNALRALVASTQVLQPFFGVGVETGSHYASIEAVRRGQADMAAVDCVSLAIWQDRHAAAGGDIQVFGQTSPYPGLPLITAGQTPPWLVNLLRECLACICTDAQYAALRKPLRIRQFQPMGLADYAVCLDMERMGRALF